jgi:hypothetical protein
LAHHAVGPAAHMEKTKHFDSARSFQQTRFQLGSEVSVKFTGESSMGVVEAMQHKKKAFTAGAISLMLLAAVSMAYQLWPQKHYSQNSAYFSDDDGKTWFLDSADRVPPFDHNGKPAFRAAIYSYDGGSKQFCGYLMRYNPDVQKKIEAAIAHGANQTPPVSPQSIMNSQEFTGLSEVKKPMSADDWYPLGSPKSLAALRLTSPDGSVLDSVIP